MQAFVFAPSGTGKSTIVDRLGYEYNWIEDSDDVIAATIGWPMGEWWNDRDVAKTFSLKAVNELLEYMHVAEHEQRDLVLLLAGFPAHVDLILESGYPIYHVILPYTENVNRLKKRERANPSRPKVSLHDLAKTRRKVREYGEGFKSLEDMVAHLNAKRYYPGGLL